MKNKVNKLKIAVIASMLLLCVLIVSVWLFSSLLKRDVTMEAGDITLSASDFLRSGPSALNYKLLTDPASVDTHVPGDYPIQFLVNGKTQISTLHIKDTIAPRAVIRDAVTLPYGTKPDLNEFIVSIDDGSAVTPEFSITLPDGVKKNDKLPSGSYNVSITLTDLGGNTSHYSGTLHICNVRQKAIAELGSTDFSASAYALSSDDRVRFAENIADELSVCGDHIITLLWNDIPVETVLTVRDTTPPTIVGAADISFPLGSTILYRKNVFVTDNDNSDIVLNVDSSKVDPLKEGSYPVVYSATDSHGNTSSAEVTLTLTTPLSVTEAEINALADDILAELNYDASEPVSYDLLYSIFKWCRTNIRYSGISDKSSSLMAAYEGLTLREGDCFTYYSVTDILLSKVGLDDMLITRKEGTYHAWNLVHFNDGWYHFDSCPLLAGETFEPFMVCDESLLAFSSAYGMRHSDDAHQNYYVFDTDAYPLRALSDLTP